MVSKSIDICKYQYIDLDLAATKSLTKGEIKCTFFVYSIVKSFTDYCDWLVQLAIDKRILSSYAIVN